MEIKSKYNTSVAIIGHTDSGKTTLIGYSLYKKGIIDQKTMERTESEARGYDKPQNKFCWLLDTDFYERRLQASMNFKINSLPAKNGILTLIDTPGQGNYIKNMISGISLADYAVIVAPAHEFDYEIYTGRSGSILNIYRTAFNSGIKYIAVLINKIDSVKYLENEYNDILTKISEKLTDVGFKERNIAFIPVCGFEGENIDHISSNMEWYKGWSYDFEDQEDNKNVTKIRGKTLFDWLETLKPAKREDKYYLRGLIFKIKNLKNSGKVAYAKIESGSLKKGDKIYISPGDFESQVISIQMHKKELEMAGIGDIVGMVLSNMVGVKKGCLFGSLRNNPPKKALFFTAHIKTLNGLGKSWSLHQNYCPILDINCTQLPVRIGKILSKIEVEENINSQSDLLILKKNEEGYAEIHPLKPISVEIFSHFQFLGRFAIRDSNHIVAFGKVISITS